MELRRQQEDERCRVVLLAPTTKVGGIATWARNLLRYNDCMRVEFRLIDTSKNYDPIGKTLNIRSCLLGMRDAVVRFLRLFSLVCKFRPHFVYITVAPSIGFVVRDVPYILALRILGVRTVLHLHGGNVRNFFSGGFVRGAVARFGLRRAVVNFVITREIERAAREIIDDEKIVFVPNMLDDAWVAPVGNKYLPDPGSEWPVKVIHVAWQDPAKGSFDLVEAMAHVQQRISCVLVGDVSRKNREAMEKRIRELRIGDKISLAGRKCGQELQDVYAGADIFVLPTHKDGPEGFPMTVLEAMAYGVPVLATEVGNIRDMIGCDTDQPAGVLLEHVDPVEPTELAAKIDLLASDACFRRRLGENGQRRVRDNYLASKLVPEIERFLCELASCRLGDEDRFWWGRMD